jgi:bacterial/archaeal transporter family protein
MLFKKYQIATLDREKQLGWSPVSAVHKPTISCLAQIFEVMRAAFQLPEKASHKAITNVCFAPKTDWLLSLDCENLERRKGCNAVAYPKLAVLGISFRLFRCSYRYFGKIGVENIDSDLATLIRTVVILLVLALIVTMTGAYQPLSTISQRTYLFLILSGLATGASWLCYYHALKLGPASGVAPIDKMSVMLVAIFAVVFLHERLSALNWVGVVMLASGVVLVAIRT